MAVAVAVPAGFATEEYASAARLGDVTPGPGAATREAAPTIRLVVRNADRLRQIQVLLDGVDVTSHVHRASDAYLLSGVPLADGAHRVSLSAESSGLFGGRLARAWRFSVDTSVPRLRLGAPTGRWLRTPLVRGRSEPGATVIVRWAGGSAAARVGEDGRFVLRPPLPQGETPVAIAVRDAAGNESGVRRTVRVDPTRPQLSPVGTWARWQRSDSPTFVVSGRDRSPLRYSATLDGRTARLEPTPGGARLETKDLAQGTHRLVVVAADAAGNRTVLRRRFGVDSTEELTSNLTLLPGARGADVERLSLRLRGAGALRQPARTVFDGVLAAAVRRYQAQHGLAADGIAGPALLSAIAGKVVVVKHARMLYVYRDGALAASFPVAVGQPKYPSPTGTYTIVSKIKDPTWIPPNSPWAKGLEPIPPGGKNPLGPRWIGTSAPAVGIHGTPDDASIGTAASHGCVRMHFADVKRVYDLVEVGMPVVFEQ